MLPEIFPVFCVGCDSFNEFLCRECAQSAKMTSTQSRDGFEFFAGFAYEGVMAKALSNFKDKHQFGYGRVMAKYLRGVFEKRHFAKEDLIQVMRLPNRRGLVSAQN
jgi:predicted amidophosphoribosyltransferase